MANLARDQPTILAVTGIQAAGKSTVSRLLARRFARGVHIEADQLQHMIVSGGAWVSEPGEPQGEAARQYRLRLKHLCLLARSFFEAGFTVVLDDSGVRWQPVGDTFQISITPDDTGKPVALPMEFLHALQQHPDEQQLFEKLSGVKQQQLADWVTNAEGEDAKRQAVERIIQILHQAHQNYQQSRQP